MQQQHKLTLTTGGTFCVFDDRGRLVGTITRPVAREPLGAGREKVYLARPEQRQRDRKAAVAA